MSGKQIAIGVVAVLVIVGAAVWIVRSQTSDQGPSETPEELVSFDLGAPAWFVCEGCGAETAGSQRPTPFECAKCGKKAVVESVRYKCEACGKTSEVYRRRTIMSPDGKRPVGVETKTAGGAWQRGVKPAVKCPSCGNEDPTKLTPALPAGLGL